MIMWHTITNSPQRHVDKEIEIMSTSPLSNFITRSSKSMSKQLF